jgi:hypothetical protein
MVRKSAKPLVTPPLVRYFNEASRKRRARFCFNGVRDDAKSVKSLSAMIRRAVLPVWRFRPTRNPKHSIGGAFAGADME